MKQKFTETKTSYFPLNGYMTDKEENYFMHFENNAFRDLPFEEQYALSGMNIMRNGTYTGDRTGVGTHFINSQQVHINIKKEIPLLQFKTVNPKNALVEIVWILKGMTNINFLKEHGVNYWDSWADKNGDLGPVYGAQARNFEGVDQVQNMIDRLNNNPECRRNIVTLWNPLRLNEMALAPCHYDYQVFTSKKNSDENRQLHLHCTQRSADWFLGVPYDFMLFYYYGLFMSIVSGYEFNSIHTTFKNYHIYTNHHDAVQKYMENFTQNPRGLNNEQYAQHSFDFQKYRNYYLELGFDGMLDMIVRNNWEFANFPQYTKDNKYGFIKAPVAV